MKEMSDSICGKVAVGGNYNSTRDNMQIAIRIDSHIARSLVNEISIIIVKNWITHVKPPFSHTV